MASTPHRLAPQPLAPPGVSDGRFLRRALALWVAGTAAAALVTLLMARAGVPGWDDAAHVYKVALLRSGQSLFWDNLWYEGSYGPITYGFLFYQLALFVPAKVLVVIAAGAAPPLFYVYQRDAWHIDDIWPAGALAGALAAYLAHGQDPFVFALAGTLGGLALLGRGHPVLAGLSAGSCVFANPMGLFVCTPFLAADVAGRPGLRRRYCWFLAVAAPFIAARILLGWVFHQAGDYVTYPSQLLLSVAFSLVGIALAWMNADHPRRPFVLLFLAYAALCGVTYAMPGNVVGNNIGRFVLVFGCPLLLLLRHSRMPRPLPYIEPALLPIVVFGLLQLSEPYSHLTHNDERLQTTEGWFDPALAAARRHHDPAYRIHVVALRRHWEAYYFPAAGFPITRGWYRQADALHNSIFYTPYDAGRYVRWLRDVGVQYVFLADAPPDAWSRQERLILRASPAFERIEQAGAWTVYRLRSAEPLLVGLTGGRGTMDEVGHTQLTLTVDDPGSYLLKFSWSPYWILEGGPGELRAGRDGFIELHAVRAGRYALRFAATPEKVADTLLQEVGTRFGFTRRGH